MIRHAFIDLSNYAFIPLCGVLVRPHLEYGMPNAEADVNRSERIPGWYKVGYKVCNWHPSHSLREEITAAEPHL